VVRRVLLAALALAATLTLFREIPGRTVREPFAFTGESLGTPSSLPIAVAGALDFLGFVHYGGPQASRFHFVADYRKARQYTGEDTAERNLMALRNIMTLNVSDPAVFLAANRTFLLHTSNSSPKWLDPYLRESGYTIKELATTPNQRLYLVTTDRTPVDR
jgi:hypothetical protein